jgi:hypothetical protein
MQSASWVALVQRIPAAQHDNLILLTSNGLEIAIQAIIRAEEDYLVLRGRMAGTDNGRILFLPYDHITYLGFQRNIKEGDVRAMFGQPKPEPAPAPKDAAPEPAPSPPDGAPEPAPAASAPPPESPPPAAEAPAPPVRKSGPRIPLPGKNAMLERLRARAQANARPPQPG